MTKLPAVALVAALAAAACGKTQDDDAGANVNAAGQAGMSSVGGAGGGSGGSGGECNRYVFVDADGDGFGTGMGPVLLSCAEPLPKGYAELTNYYDCDDTTAAVWQLMAPDVDGDGYTQNDGMQCLGADAPSGWARVALNDCDDQDAGAYVQYYPDADGDGSGSDAPDAVICGGEETPGGYVSHPYDCDDSDAARNQTAPEQWADGVDSNCDGQDAPVDCAYPSGWECLCDYRAQVALPLASSCSSGPDLYLQFLGECVVCGPNLLLIAIGNRGGAAGVAKSLSFEILPSSDGRAADSPPPPIMLERSIEPGEVVSPILLPFVWPLSGVTLETSDGDCDLGNDTLAIANDYSECTFR